MDDAASNNARLKAEEALRQSEGDPERARQILEQWVDSDEGLRSAFLKAAIRRQLEEARRLQKQERKCPYCAEEVSADALKCKHCGEWLDPEAAEEAAEAAATQVRLLAPRVWYFVLFTGWVLILLVAALIYTLTL